LAHHQTHKDLRKTHITFTWENGQSGGSNKKYDEFKALAYNLKEYSSYEIMMKDYEFYETIAIDTTTELEELRKVGHSLYTQSCIEYEEKQKEIKEKEDLKKNMYDYLNQRIDLDQKTFSNVTCTEPQILVGSHVRYIAYHIIKYYKGLNKSIPIGHLKNQAINFLYNQDYIDEDQILSYVNI
jgi:hypothetical protein